MSDPVDLKVFKVDAGSLDGKPARASFMGRGEARLSRTRSPESLAATPDPRRTPDRHQEPETSWSPTAPFQTIESETGFKAEPVHSPYAPSPLQGDRTCF